MKFLVRRQGALGDVLETTAIIHRLRQENPDAIIDVDTEYKVCFVANNDINADRPIEERKYDRVIDLNMAFENALRKLHPIDAYSEVAFGDRATPHELHFNFTHAEFLHSTKTKTAVLHAARSWPIRTLPKAFWQEVALRLDEAGYLVILTGTAQDHDGLTNVFDARGRLNLQQQAGLINSASVFICSESGPMILAQVTRTPIVVLRTMVPWEHITHVRNGKSAWRFYDIPANVSCIGCAALHPEPVTFFDCLYDHRNCLTSFSAQQVVETAIEVSITPGEDR